MKIINNDFYTNNWQDFVHSWVMRRVEHLVQRYDLPLDVDTIESFRIDTTEYGTHDFVFTYTKDGVEHTLTITPKNDDVEISISDNSTWVVNGEDTGKNTAGQMGPTGKQGLKGVAGDKGPIGKKGITGLQGPQGNGGVTGDKGEKGLIGKKGETGLQGEQGLQGPQGDRGKTGVHGEQGKQGLQGMKGETGDQGPRGVAGTVTGEKGPIGPTGAKGEDGDQGPTGSQGPQGIIGETGNKGPIGETGDQGPMGDQGPIGPQGPIGDKGPQGDSADVAITLNDNGNFYVNGEDTGKPWEGLPGNVVGLTEENYKDQLLYASGEMRESTLSKYNFSFGPITWSATGSGSNSFWIATNNNDEDYSGYYNLPSTFKAFAIGCTSVSNRGIKNYYTYLYPIIYPINVISFGLNFGNILSYTSNLFSIDDTKEPNISISLSYEYDTVEDLYKNYLTDYFYGQYALSSFTKGIIKVTDPSGHVRTFQPTKFIIDLSAPTTYERESTYYVYYKSYTQGPQSQWNDTFDTTEAKYNYKIDIIDNDGNMVDCGIMNCPVPFGAIN